MAIKTIIFSGHNNVGGVSKSRVVLMEAALSKSISHPNIVATYACELKAVPVSLHGSGEPNSGCCC